MSELNKLGLADARDALRKGETTSVELPTLPFSLVNCQSKIIALAG